ncbi:hypothetical protein CXB51_001980 [Gossypium anomalum]|uniref:DUF7745 domain-containing protein n=1 Tax=Gossypium anomalum TaxID=47600 RepID=A0A8J6DCE4_9ROSI|nr:hypothetical protein CXB51_001980 [Gossypium anomalum]
MAQFWNSAYSCFTFGRVDLVPTVEEYTALLRCPKVQADKVYSKAAGAPAFVKKLMNITGMSEQWVTARIQQKGDSRCILWVSLKDLIIVHPDTKRKVGVFALSVYGLVMFPKALRHIDEAVTDFFDRLDKRVTLVPAILAETLRSLSACRRTGEVFSESYSSLKEIAAMSRRDGISDENWIVLLRNLQEEDVEWRAPWFVPDEILYQCGSFDWVPLLGIWGTTGYAPLLVLRQYRSRQFIPMTHGLAQSEFAYKEKNYRKKVQEISDAWKQTRRMKRLAVGSMTTPEYKGWLSKRVNDNIPELSLEDVRMIEEYLQVIPSELEIVKRDFEERNAELEKKIEQLEEEKMHLRLDADVQKLEAEKLKKGKRKVEEDLDSLKTDYKKLRMSIRTAGLGKTALKKTLVEGQCEKEMLVARVAELEKALHQHRGRNSDIELRASLSKVEDLKGKVEELEAALQNCELRVDLLESNNEQWKEQLRRS